MFLGRGVRVQECKGVNVKEEAEGEQIHLGVKTRRLRSFLAEGAPRDDLGDLLGGKRVVGCWREQSSR